VTLIVDILKDLAKKLLFWGLVATVVVVVWNFFKDQREERTFIASFSNVEGLSKGAPIYAKGVKIGKVIKIFPLGNTNNVGVKGLITDKNYPSPKSEVSARIISNIEKGGGNIVEITNINSGINVANMQRNKEANFFEAKGQNPFMLKHTLRVMRDFLQLGKDFSMNFYEALNSRKSLEYQEKLENSVKNTVTSLEYGTVKHDVKNSIKDLNDQIHDFEEDPNRQQKVERDVKNKMAALRNTIGTFGSLAEVYNEK